MNFSLVLRILWLNCSTSHPSIQAIQGPCSHLTSLKATQPPPPPSGPRWTGAVDPAGGRQYHPCAAARSAAPRAGPGTADTCWRHQWGLWRHQWRHSAAVDCGSWSAGWRLSVSVSVSVFSVSECGGLPYSTGCPESSFTPIVCQ